MSDAATIYDRVCAIRFTAWCRGDAATGISELAAEMGMSRPGLLSIYEAERERRGVIARAEALSDAEDSALIAVATVLAGIRRLSGSAAAHAWTTIYGLPVCGTCGTVRRADGKNRPCRGVPPRIDTRREPAEVARAWREAIGADAEWEDAVRAALERTEAAVEAVRQVPRQQQGGTT